MNCGKFIGELMRVRDITHIEHLQSKHWGSHMALNEVYEAMEEHIDTVAELRLARGPVKIEVKSIPAQVNIIPYLESFVTKLDMAKEMMDSKGYNDISAEIDMIKATAMKGLYKLKNLSKKNRSEEEHSKEEDMVEGGILYHKKCKGGKTNRGGKMLIKEK